MNKKLIKLALCHAISEQAISEQPNAAGNEPLWLPLVPLGAFTGRDGRQWTANDAQAIINNTELPFILDLDHGSELSDDTSASGWFTELKHEDGVIYGKLELNAKGKKALADKEYKWYSPAYWVDKNTQEVLAFTSVALTNKPNLPVPALNAQSAQQQNEEQDAHSPHYQSHKSHYSQHGEPPMKELLLSLGLSADASEQSALNAVQTLKSRAEKPDVNAFVPKATHDQVVTELNTVKQQLADKAKADHEAAVEVAINTAISDKKIAPADKDFYTACCATDKGLEDFRQFISAKAPIIGDAALPANPPAGGETALNKEQKNMLNQLGLSATDITTDSNETEA